MIAVIDYGAGNLRSVISALDRVGAPARIARTASDLSSARALILPGVGAASDTMENLRSRGLADAIVEWIRSDRPFLGICMGLQVLFGMSEEGGRQECLGALSGRVVRLKSGLKIPHMGWNQVRYAKRSSLFSGIPEGSHFYFVHSYVVQPDDSSIVLGVTEYGADFCSAVQRGNVFATQFHPEKSGERGLQVYRNFVSGIPS